ncbi:hypothetical protein [Bradyrhizobium genosp. P]|uniref:hypothetical protein n=1 Tax=Bradyrhizobium genosp. P TaxID=83641 RepID=UPI003CF718EC
MSDDSRPIMPDGSPPPSLPPQLPPPRSGCATAFMVVFGLILLLPGLCALMFGGGLFSSHPDPTLLSLVLLGLLLGFAGVMLIYFAARGPRGSR